MSKQLINIALDLETLSTREDAAIIQIGAAVPLFDQIHLPEGISPHFEATIRYEDCLSSEFHKDHTTMSWWENQNPKVRAYVFSGQDTYTDAFDHFAWWIASLKSPNTDVAVWGNGSDFDNRLLAYSLDSLGYHNVWSFRNNRDLRTLKALFPTTIADLPSGHPHPEIKHTALGDARYEARLIHATKMAYDLENL